MKDGLESIVDALGEHETNKAAGNVGHLIEARCPDCGWHAHSNTMYLSPGLTEDDGRAWMLKQHECPTVNG